MRHISTSVIMILLLIETSFAKTEEAMDLPEIPQVWTARAAVDFALKNNPDSQIALSRIASARAMIMDAESRFFPVINLSSEYGQTDNPMYSFGNILNEGKFNNSINFNDPGRTDDLNLRIQAQYRLYNGGRNQAARDAAQAYEKGATAELTAVHHQLGFEVVRLFQIISSQMEVVVARESTLAAIRASVKVAASRYEAGTLMKVDLLNLEVQEAASSEDLIQAQHYLKLSKKGFLSLLGLRTGDVVIDPRDDNLQLPAEPNDFSHRPELRALNQAIQAGKAEVRGAEGGRYPTLDGFASYQMDQGYVFKGYGDSWMTGLRLNVTLHDGNRTRAGILAAKERLIQLKGKKTKTELALNLEFQQALLDYQQAGERLSVTEKMVTVAQESARLSRARFAEGVILASDLIDAEKRLTDARVRQSSARMMRQTAIANLRRTTGLPPFDQVTEEPQETH